MCLSKNNGTVLFLLLIAVDRIVVPKGSQVVATVKVVILDIFSFLGSKDEAGAIEIFFSISHLENSWFASSVSRV